jgi:hypothetical protein
MLTASRRVFIARLSPTWGRGGHALKAAYVWFENPRSVTQAKVRNPVETLDG